VIDLVTVAWHTIAIYLFLIVSLRLAGRRPVTQITFVELVVITILGSSVETAMVAGNTSLPAGLVAATVLLLANRLLAVALGRWPRLQRIVLGRPVIIVHDGALHLGNLRRVGLTPADVESAIRERGYPGPEAVRYAVLEIDGSVGVIPADSP
jgi:uncharacterized membrane protein YcaP (DUF421 family)